MRFVPWSARAVVAVAFMTQACGAGTAAIAGSAGSSPVSAQATLEVVGSSPAPNETGFDPKAPIAIGFSRPIASSALPADALEVRDARGQPVQGSLSADGAALTFVPARSLDFLETYTARLSPEIRSTDGVALGSAPQLTFGTRDGSWRSLEAVFSDSRAVAVGGASEAVALGMVPIPSQVAISVSRRGTAGWLPPEIFSFGELGDQSETAIATDAGGSFAFLFATSTFMHGSGLASTTGAFLPDTGLENFGQAIGPVVAADEFGAGGTAVGVFERFGFEVMGATFDAGAGWSKAVVLNGPAANPQNGNRPSVAAGSGGAAVASWRQAGAGPAFTRLWANVRASGAAWDPARSAKLFDFADPIDEIAVGMAAGPRAFAVVVSGGGLFATRLEGAAWTTPEPLVSEFVCSASAADPSVSIDVALGDRAMVVARTIDGIASRCFDPATGWLPEEQVPIALHCGYLVRGPLVGLDDEGRAVTVWVEEDLGFNSNFRSRVVASRYRPGAGWSEPELLAEVTNESAAELGFGMNRRGKAVAVWSDGDNSSFTRAFE